jgi:hypothetical protein
VSAWAGMVRCFAQHRVDALVDLQFFSIKADARERQGSVQGSVPVLVNLKSSLAKGLSSMYMSSGRIVSSLFSLSV